MNIEILLVDDDEMTLFIHEKILKKCTLDHPYFTFTSGRKAIDYIFQKENESKKFILFLDINMPEMDGWDVINELKKSGFVRRGVIIMATSSVDYSDKVKAKSFECVIDFLEKPLTLETCERLASLPEIVSLGEF